MVAALILLTLIYLPGAVAFRAPLANRERRAALAAEERMFWALVISLAWTTFVALALAAGNAYTLERVALVNGLATAAGLIAWRGRLRLGPGAPRPGWTALVPAALAALGLWLFFPSSEYIMGGKDPGTYINEGVEIAQSGSLVIRDPLIGALPPEVQPLFWRTPKRPVLRNRPVPRFMGFFVTDRKAGLVAGQFPHAFPVWIAVGYGIDGLTGARQAVGFWAVFGLLAVYFAGARFVGRPAAACGAALLALNVASVWFAKYPNSEVMQQALVFAGVLALARAQQDGDRFFAPVAAVVLGLLAFVRLDAAVVVAAVAGGLAVSIVDGKRPRLSFVLILGLLLAAAWFYLNAFTLKYMLMPIRFVLGHQALLAAAVTTALAGLALLVWVSRRERLAGVVRLWLPRLLVLVTLAAAAYAYWLRQPGGDLAPHDAAAFRTFAWYVLPAGLAAGLLGFALVTWRGFWREPVLLLMTAAFGFVFFYKIRIVPEHFWLARRYLPVLLPVTCLLAAAAAFSGYEAWRRRAGAPGTGAPRRRLAGAGHLVVPGVFLGLLGWQFYQASRPLRTHVEYAGLIPAIERLADRLRDDDLVLIESRGASDAHVFGAPLAYIYDRAVLQLQPQRPDQDRFDRLMQWAAGRFGRVVFLADGGTDLTFPTLQVTPLEAMSIEVPEYESLRNAYPAQVRQKKFGLGLYELRAGPRAAPVVDVDLGTFDDTAVVHFFAKERGEGRSYRWSRNVSYVTVLGVTAAARELVLTASNGGRPAAGGEARVEVFLGDTPLGAAVITPGFRDYRLPIPPAAAAAAAQGGGPVIVRLQSATWTPQAVRGGGDDRQLGVMVDRLRIE